MAPIRFFLSLLLLAAGSPAQAQLIKGLPYISEEVTERIQNLADGNQLINRSTLRVYRDGAGRTRRERYDAKGNLESASLTDAEGAAYTLLPERKTAVKAVKAVTVSAAPKLNDALAKSQQKGASSLVLNGVPRADGSAAPALTVVAANTLANPQLARLAADAFTDSRYAASRVVKPLGQRFIEGQQSEGTLISYEIPEGAQGNRLPMTISTEMWEARELRIIMYSKRSDPRSGDIVTRVTSLRREEPSAAMLALPADYTVVEQAPFSTITIERKAAKQD